MKARSEWKLFFWLTFIYPLHYFDQPSFNRSNLTKWAIWPLLACLASQNFYKSSKLTHHHPPPPLKSVTSWPCSGLLSPWLALVSSSALQPKRSPAGNSTHMHPNPPSGVHSSKSKRLNIWRFVGCALCLYPVDETFGCQLIVVCSRPRGLATMQW